MHPSEYIPLVFTVTACLITLRVVWWVCSLRKIGAASTIRSAKRITVIPEVWKR